MADRQRRRSIRLTGHDDASPAAYFVTVCTQGRACLFGEVMHGAMIWNEAGGIVADAWNALPTDFRHVAPDAFVVMPNHVHGVIHRQPPGPARGSVGAIVGSFKSAVARIVNAQRGTPGALVGSGEPLDGN